MKPSQFIPTDHSFSVDIGITYQYIADMLPGQFGIVEIDATTTTLVFRPHPMVQWLGDSVFAIDLMTGLNLDGGTKVRILPAGSTLTVRVK